ncbi:MAG: DNA adenine methylase [Ruminococcus sp.]
MYKKVKPFIKWAGGKTQLLNDIRKKYPHKIIRYCEPFVGGGAVLLDIIANFNPEEILINDINSELINTYWQIKSNPKFLIKELSDLQENFLKADTKRRKEIFLYQRNRFNQLKTKDTNNLEKAVLFIFLNKTCYNGLYRVNKKGLFNVPIGSYKNPLICDEENILLISGLLKNVKIKCGDYSDCLEFIDKDTFVYIDPPYRPLTETSSFNSYSEKNFDDNEQIRLSEFIDSVTLKGAKIVASNSDPKNINEKDCFFDDLYSEYNIMRVPAKRIINSKGNGRGSINELLISNY